MGWLVTAIVALLTGLVAVVVSYRKSFIRHPFHAALQACLGLLVLLVGSLVVPSLDMDVTFSVDGPPIQIDGKVVRFSTGTPPRNIVILSFPIAFVAGLSMLKIQPVDPDA